MRLVNVTPSARTSESQAEAEEFAEELRQRSRDAAWEVVPVNGAWAQRRMVTALQNTSVVGTEELEAALDDFIPPSYPTEIDLQNLVAVLECTSKCLLPKQYRDADRSELIRRMNELQMLNRRD